MLLAANLKNPKPLNRSNFPCSQEASWIKQCNCIADHRHKYSPWHAFYTTHHHF
jgi:hypothetical protein